MNSIILYNIVSMIAREVDCQMPTVEVVAALLEAVTPADIHALPPAQRRRFARACRQAAEMAEPKRERPKAGVLYDLCQGERGQ